MIEVAQLLRVLSGEPSVRLEHAQVRPARSVRI
jgi:hypothetical protein